MAQVKSKAAAQKAALKKATTRVKNADKSLRSAEQILAALKKARSK
jgi:hypothetical protein